MPSVCARGELRRVAAANQLRLLYAYSRLLAFFFKAGMSKVHRQPSRCRIATEALSRDKICAVWFLWPQPKS
jgi:hypothetical protein